MVSYKALNTVDESHIQKDNVYLVIMKTGQIGIQMIVLRILISGQDTVNT